MASPARRFTLSWVAEVGQYADFISAMDVTGFRNPAGDDISKIIADRWSTFNAPLRGSKPSGSGVCRSRRSSRRMHAVARPHARATTGIRAPLDSELGQGIDQHLLDGSHKRAHVALPLAQIDSSGSRQSARDRGKSRRRRGPISCSSIPSCAAAPLRANQQIFLVRPLRPTVTTCGCSTNSR